MSVFVDTSAIMAVVDEAEEHHVVAAEAWRQLVDGREELWITNYVLLEAFAVLQRRLGLTGVRRFWDDMGPALSVAWVDEALHSMGVAAMLSAGRRELSLVDCVSFQAMRSLGIRTAFTVDPHFEEQGFACVPALDDG